jgi:hypothetical protein
MTYVSLPVKDGSFFTASRRIPDETGPDVPRPRRVSRLPDRYSFIAGAARTEPARSSDFTGSPGTGGVLQKPRPKHEKWACDGGIPD